MNREKYLKVMGYVGISLFFLGLGLFLGRTFEKITIELSKLIFIVVGLIFIIISFIPKKK